jgi:sterol desaturase/sphingolipid hydroxylase (fatty acid hydroxylase superfamily)
VDDPRPQAPAATRLDRLVERGLGDDEPGHFGSGWWSGILSVFLGALALGAVLCLRFPAVLTTPTVRDLLPLPGVRTAVQVSLIVAFLAGLLSAALRRRKALGLTGMALCLAASLLGGSTVDVPASVETVPSMGLDWFVVNVLLLAFLFVPLERLRPLRQQSAFRPGWTTDLVHFFVSHLLVQLSTFLTLFPARALFGWIGSPGLQHAVAAQPWVLQVIEIVFVADLAEYTIHRTFHRVPWLWRFHQIHHSSRSMDWIAGSRLHLVDTVATRAFVFLPLFFLGFEQPPLYAYLVFVSFHAVFIHANVGFDLGPLEAAIVTPRFHHWHHAAHPNAADKNFAVHLPWIDGLFGTRYLPARSWPERYGIAGDPVPEGYTRQLVHPFAKV